MHANERLNIGVLIGVALISLVIVGASTMPSHKKAVDWHRVKLQVGQKWFALEELRGISTSALLSQSKLRDLSHLGITADIHDRNVGANRDTLVTFSYVQDYGYPAYYVTINTQGVVSGITSRIPTTGDPFGSPPPGIRRE